MELNKIKHGHTLLHMVQTILLPTQQIVLQLSRLQPTQPLLTSGLMLLVKVQTQLTDSGTLLAKAQDNLTILTPNSEILLSTVQLNSKLVINFSQRMEPYSVLNPH